MPSTATMTQPSTLTTQQAAATLPTPPISTVTITVPSSPSSISSSIPSSLISALQTPPPATDSREEELPEVEDMLATPSMKTVSTPAQPVSPPPACRSTQIAQKQAQSSTTSSTTYASNTASSLQRQNTRSSGGAGPGLSKWFHPDWKDPEASHLTDDEDFAFLSETDPLIIATAQDASDDPTTVREARSHSDWPLWKAAMDKKISTLEQASTWSTIPRPTNKNIISSKWVFRIKRKADGTIDKYKARLVARGFTQIYGINYFDTYSPVAKMASFRTILAMAACLDWDIESFDFNGAYLNATLDDDEELYMHEPPGYETQGEHMVKRLHKSLYGLKQAGRKWYDTLTRSLADLGFCISYADPGVFLAKLGRHTLILAIHIDNCILTGSSPELISQYSAELNDCYALTDLGSIHWPLGIKTMCNRSAHIISLSQTVYIDSTISHFGLSDIKSYTTPMFPEIVHVRCYCPSNATEADRMKITFYCEAIGNPMHASTAICPDITYDASAPSRFLDNPSSIHWKAAKQVLRYLSGTGDLTLTLTYGGKRCDFIGHTNADSASHEHHHAIPDCMFLTSSGAIPWQSCEHKPVILSTTEVKYVATTHTIKEAIWLRHLISKSSLTPTSLITLFCDSQVTIKLATDDKYHMQTNHVDIPLHFTCRTSAVLGCVAFEGECWILHVPCLMPTGYMSDISVPVPYSTALLIYDSSLSLLLHRLSNAPYPKTYFPSLA